MSEAKKHSPTDLIFEQLSEVNPFEKAPVVREQNIWGESFPDVPSLNSHASDAVFKALKEIKESSSPLEKNKSIVITAMRGVGKTHLLQRIRKALEVDDQSLFIYSGVDKYGDLDFANTSFQESLANSLDRDTANGLTQWQKIAASMTVAALKQSNVKASNIPTENNIAQKFDVAVENSREKGKDLVKNFTAAIRKLHPKSDPYLLKAILWTLSEERGAFAVKWLSGEVLEPKDAIDLGLPVKELSEKEREAGSLKRCTELLGILSSYKTILVCFDELDVISVDGNGYPTEIVILNLVRSLFSNVEQHEKSHGLALVTVMLPDKWRQAETIDFSSSMDKVSTHGKAIDLRAPDAESLGGIISLWLQQFYEKKSLVPPERLFPFTQEEIQTHAKLKLTIRENIRWCANLIEEKVKDYQPSTIAIIEPKEQTSSKERLENAYANAIKRYSEEILDDNEAISSALRFSFETILQIKRLEDSPIEGFLLKAVEEITPKSKNNGYLNFKISGIENEQPVTIGIGVLQQTHGLTVGAGFRRLLSYEIFGLTRSCLIRSKQRKLKRNWDSYEYYKELVGKGGEWVNLEFEALVPLLALQYVYEHHEKFDLSIKALNNSLSLPRKVLSNNLILKEILSKPEGALAEDAWEGQELLHLHSEEEMQQLAKNLKEAFNETESDSEPELDLDILGGAA